MMVANGLEGVPWMISGADHSADVARVLAYAATSGTSGIISPNDLKVVPSGTANMQVHVGVGAFSVVNRSGGVQSQSYVGRGIAVSDLNVATTGSSARSDLVVLRVKDPQFAPWQGLYTSSTDLANGPYAFPEIIPGVPANTVRAEQLGLPQSLYALARLDLPSGTTAGVTSGMIKDLRKLSQPHFLPFNDLQMGPSGGEQMLTTDTAWKNWPSTATTVEVPTWATHADVTVELLNLGVDGPVNVSTRVNFGGLIGPSFFIDYNGAAPTYANFAVETLQHTTYAPFDVTSIAGTTQTLRLNAQRTFASEAPGRILVDSSSQVRFRVEFFQRAY